MHLVRHRARTAGLAAAILATALGGAPTGPVGAAELTSSGSWTASATQPFSDPVWMPVRDPVRVSCTHSNCPGPYHGYWAIDFLGERDLPLYAAGAGIVHVGATNVGCGPAGTTATRGNWVWIDHGGGVVSRYHHLNRVTVQDGDLVTPSTVIGTMGISGVPAPCEGNYLHFEVRTRGVNGQRMNPGALQGCLAGRRVSFPSYWGVASWNSLAKARSITPVLDGSCLPQSTPGSAAPTGLSARAANESVGLSWQPPAGSAADRYVITREVWSPQLSRWHSIAYRSLDRTTTSTSFSGLTNGRTYRFRVTAHTPPGYSTWTGHVTAIPATTPLPPRTGRLLTATTTAIRFGWWRSRHRGAPLTGNRVAIRQRTASGWTRWRYTQLPWDAVSHRWTGLRPGRTYEMTVQAQSAMGPSAWGTRQLLRTYR